MFNMSRLYEQFEVSALSLDYNFKMWFDGLRWVNKVKNGCLALCLG